MTTRLRCLIWRRLLLSAKPLEIRCLSQEVRSCAPSVFPPSHFLLSHISMMIQVILTGTRDPLGERQNLVQRWCFILFFLVVHFLLLNTIHRSVSNKTPRGGKPRILRNRLQSEDQVRLLFLDAFFNTSSTRISMFRRT